jgi:hypothetical protein
LLEQIRKARRFREPFVAKPRSAEGIHIHSWLNDRVAALDYERYGLWPRLRRFLLRFRFGRS